MQELFLKKSDAIDFYRKKKSELYAQKKRREKIMELLESNIRLIAAAESAIEDELWRLEEKID